MKEPSNKDRKIARDPLQLVQTGPEVTSYWVRLTEKICWARTKPGHTALVKFCFKQGSKKYAHILCSTNPINKPPMEKTHKASDAQCIIASIARKLYMAYQESNCQKCVIAADCFNPCVNTNFRSDISLPRWKSGSHSPPSSWTLGSILSMRAWFFAELMQ